MVDNLTTQPIKRQVNAHNGAFEPVSHGFLRVEELTHLLFDNDGFYQKVLSRCFLSVLLA